MSPVPEGQPDHAYETQDEDKEDENLDEAGSKEAAEEIARIVIEQAQQQAKDQALIDRVCHAPIGAMWVSHPLLEWDRGQALAK